MTIDFPTAGPGRARQSLAGVAIGALPDADSASSARPAEPPQDWLSQADAATLLSPLNGQKRLQPAQIPALYLQALNAVIAQEAIRQGVAPRAVADQLRDSVQRYTLWQGQGGQPGLRLQANEAFADLYVAQVLAPQLRQLAEQHGLAAGALAGHEAQAREAIIQQLQDSSAKLAQLPASIEAFVQQLDQALQAASSKDPDPSGSTPQTADTATREATVNPHETLVSSKPTSPLVASADVFAALPPVPVTPLLQLVVPGVSYRLPLSASGQIQPETLSYFFARRTAGLVEVGRTYQISLYNAEGEAFGVVQLYFHGWSADGERGSTLTGPNGEMEMNEGWLISAHRFSRYLNELKAQEIRISVNTSVPAQPPTWADLQALKETVLEVLNDTAKVPNGKFNTLLQTPFFPWLAYPEVWNYFSGEFLASLSPEQLKNWREVAGCYTRAQTWEAILNNDAERTAYSTAYFLGLEYAIRLQLSPQLGTPLASEIIETIQNQQNDPSFQGQFAWHSVSSFMPEVRQIDEVLRFLNALATPGLVYQIAPAFKADSRFQALMDASPTWTSSDFDDAVRAAAFFKRFPALVEQVPFVPDSYRLDLRHVDWVKVNGNAALRGQWDTGFSGLDLENMLINPPSGLDVGVALDPDYVNRHIQNDQQTTDVLALQQNLRNNPGLLWDQGYQSALRQRLQEFEQTVDGLRALGLADNPEGLLQADLSGLDKKETDSSLGPFIGGKMGQQPDHELNESFDPNNINKKGLNEAVPAMIPGQARQPRENLEYPNTANTTLPELEALLTGFPGQNSGTDQSDTGRTPQAGETLFGFLQRHGAVLTSPLGTEGQWSVLPSPQNPVDGTPRSNAITRLGPSGRPTKPSTLQRLQRLAPLQREAALLQAAADVRAGRPTANAKLLIQLIGTAAGVSTVLRSGWGDTLLKVLSQQGNSQLLLRYRTADLALAGSHPLAARFSLQLRQVLAQRAHVVSLPVRQKTTPKVLVTLAPQGRAPMIKPAADKPPAWLARSQAPVRITALQSAPAAKSLQDIQALQAQWLAVKALRGQKNLPQLQAQLKALHQSLQSLQVQMQRQVNALPGAAQQAGQLLLSQTQAAVQQFAEWSSNQQTLHDIAYGAGVVAIGIWWTGEFVLGTFVNVWTGLGKLTGWDKGTI